MIVSMTGFGGARAEVDGVAYQVEIRSVNNRYFKLSMRVPEHLQRYEAEIEKQLRSRLDRGSVNYSLRMAGENAAAAYAINGAAMSHYLRRLREIVGADDAVRIDLASLLAIPGVCQPPDIDEATLASQFAVVQDVTAKAMEALVEMRRAEGVALLSDLQAQCAEVRMRLGQIEPRAPLVVENFARRLRSRMEQMLGGSTVDLQQDALVREVAIHAERCDINEEIARIKSHLDQFASSCDSPEEAGRKLDFLAQELLREANTIGSKANDVEIARHVVGIKAAIDRIKEQVKNVE
ncbi:MAG: YicC family protein [Phycisphaerae bacterium]|nr:YicC family protein [Phycisphaerae bacterium]